MTPLQWDTYISTFGLTTVEERSVLVDCILRNGIDERPSQGLKGWTRLPLYIKPLSDELIERDIADLQKKGALSVPCDQIRNELFLAFLKYVYPFMPVVDLRNFLHVIITRRDTSGPRISLFLFHAVMFAGAMFVDTCFLHQLGYQSRKDACSDFYRKATLLHELEYDSDPLSKIPALLLLSYSYDDNDDKDPRYWISSAISSSVKARLDDDGYNYVQDAAVGKLRRRIWWSCYIRDRLASLAAGRPLSVKHDTKKISMLSIDDFEFADIHRYISVLSSDFAQKQQELAIICIEMARLCVCIGKVLSTRFSRKAINDPELADSMRMILQPISPQAIRNHYIENELLLWFLNLPPEAELGTQSYEVMSGQTDISLVHRGFLHLVYYACRGACCPIQPTASIDEINISQRMVLKSKRKHYASSSVTIVKNLQDHQVVQFLPPTAAPILLPTLIELICAHKFKKGGSENALDDVGHCLEALEALQYRYNVVAIVLEFIEVFRQRIGCSSTSPELVSESDLDIQSNYQKSLCSSNGGEETSSDVSEQVMSSPWKYSDSLFGNDGIIMDLDEFLNLQDY